MFGRALESEAPTTATRLGRKKVSRSIERRATGRPVISRTGWPEVGPRWPRRASQLSSRRGLGALRGLRRLRGLRSFRGLLGCCHVPPSYAPPDRRSPARYRAASVPQMLREEVRQTRSRAPADALTVYDIRVSVDPGGGAIRGPGGRIVAPPLAPLRYVTDVSVFSLTWGSHGYSGRQDRDRDRVGSRDRPGRGAGAGARRAPRSSSTTWAAARAARVPTSGRPTRWSR